MRVGIVGLGRMGVRHLLACRRLGLDVVGAFDVRPEVAREVKDGLPDSPPRLTGSVHELLALDLDCLIIATTAPAHCDLTIAAAQQGIRHVLCEKPMATSVEECNRMLQACSASGTKLAVNHQVRFMEQYLKVRECLQEPMFGELRSVTVVGGNIGVGMNGIHYFELFRWLTGEDACRVTAWLSDDGPPNPRGPEFEDRGGSVRVDVASGRRLYMEIGPDQGHGVHVTYAGRTGIMVADELSGSIRLSARQMKDLDLPTTRYGCLSVIRDIAVTPADVIEPTISVLSALLEGSGYPAGEDGRHALAVLIAAHESNDANHAGVAPAEVPVRRSLPIP